MFRGGGTYLAHSGVATDPNIPSLHHLRRPIEYTQFSDSPPWEGCEHEAEPEGSQHLLYLHADGLMISGELTAYSVTTVFRCRRLTD